MGYKSLFSVVYQCLLLCRCVTSARLSGRWEYDVVLDRSCLRTKSNILFKYTCKYCLLNDFLVTHIKKNIFLIISSHMSMVIGGIINLSY